MKKNTLKCLPISTLRPEHPKRTLKAMLITNEMKKITKIYDQ